jgi:hypothetical protein
MDAGRDLEISRPESTALLCSSASDGRHPKSASGDSGGGRSPYGGAVSRPPLRGIVSRETTARPERSDSRGREPGEDEDVDVGRHVTRERTNATTVASLVASLLATRAQIEQLEAIVSLAALNGTEPRATPLRAMRDELRPAMALFCGELERAIDSMQAQQLSAEQNLLAARRLRADRERARRQGIAERRQKLEDEVPFDDPFFPGSGPDSSGTGSD